MTQSGLGWDPNNPVIIRKTILPFADLSAMNVPEDFLQLSPHVLLTLSALSAQGPNGAKLLSSDSIGRLITSAQVNDIQVVAVSSAAGQGVISIPDTSDWSIGDIARILTVDVNGNITNDIWSDVIKVVDNQSITIRSSLQAALQPGDRIQRVPNVTIGSQGQTLIGNLQNTQINTSLTFVVTRDVLALGFANIGQNVTPTEIQALTWPSGQRFFDVKNPQENFYTVVPPAVDSQFKVTVTWPSTAGTGFLQVLAFRSGGAMHVYAPVDKPLNVSRIGQNPALWEGPNQPPALISDTFNNGTSKTYVSAVAGQIVRVFYIGMAFDTVPGAGNSILLRDTQGNAYHSFSGSTTVPPPFISPTGVSLGAAGTGLQLVGSTGVAIVARGSIIYSQG